MYLSKIHKIKTFSFSPFWNIHFPEFELVWLNILYTSPVSHWINNGLKGIKKSSNCVVSSQRANYFSNVLNSNNITFCLQFCFHGSFFFVNTPSTAWFFYFLAHHTVTLLNIRRTNFFLSQNKKHIRIQNQRVASIFI